MDFFIQNYRPNILKQYETFGIMAENPSEFEIANFIIHQ